MVARIGKRAFLGLTATLLMITIASGSDRDPAVRWKKTVIDARFRS